MLIFMDNLKEASEIFKNLSKKQSDSFSYREKLFNSEGVKIPQNYNRKQKSRNY